MNKLRVVVESSIPQIHEFDDVSTLLEFVDGLSWNGVLLYDYQCYEDVSDIPEALRHLALQPARVGATIEG